MDPWQIVAGSLAGVIGTAVGFLYRAVSRGDWVPGVTYRIAVKEGRDERKARLLAERRADRAEFQAERNTLALREASATTIEATATLVSTGEQHGAPRG